MGQLQAPADTIAAWTPMDLISRDLWAEYIAFAEDEANVYRETSASQHLTASAFVFEPGLEHILLCFHSKGLFWVQFGGHLERDDLSLADAARREGTEESGVDRFIPALHTPVDLDRHALSSRFGSCEVHWDVGFAFFADLDAHIEADDESEHVAWWPIADLPDGCVQGLAERIARIVKVLRANPSTARA